MHITIDADQFRALVRGEPVTLGTIGPSHRWRTDGEPVEAILADVGFPAMLEAVYGAAAEANQRGG